MEDTRVLNWDQLPVLRKAQILTTAAGAFVTIGVPVLLDVFSKNGIGIVAYYLIFAQAIILSPAKVICIFFGSELLNGGGKSLFPSPLAVLLAVFLNSLLSFAVGSAIGILLTRNTRKNDH